MVYDLQVHTKHDHLEKTTDNQDDCFPDRHTFEVQIMRSEIARLKKENYQLADQTSRLAQENEFIFSQSQDMEFQMSTYKKVATEAFVIKAELKRHINELQEDIALYKAKLKAVEDDRDSISSQLETISVTSSSEESTVVYNRFERRASLPNSGFDSKSTSSFDKVMRRLSLN